ncbi:twin-arginine translocase subunit TatC [Pseudalkalibacillus caeni]|uniref:Sec-independent protein translocase protein TatC n=1 Tax=Exobacillus caeni TaxID=2574798 RepID=A0A5R9F3Q7_9BACL|nr:twin-arginine translocase subunit TatC [Pseudalkalibacillus caeni]TLS37139.1 twin-arginine translocase subunit TatC [Pseudalkalibacillus caeni]
MDRDLYLAEHLEELRRRLIITTGFFLIFFIVFFVYVENIYEFLIKDLEDKLAILGPADILWVYFLISGVFAIAFTIPIAAYQIWKFVLPALDPNERKSTLLLIPSLFILFLTGIGFGYMIVFPTVLSFMQNMSTGHFETFYTTEKYFRFMINLTFPFGVLFELPAVILFLTSLGILNPARLAKTRKIAYFILIVTAVLITPPDFISDFLVMVPLLLLYEVSITLSRVVYRKKLRKENFLHSNLKS